jgi:hypothetical protein
MRSFNQKVKVIRHQRESKHLNWVPRFCQREDGKKGLLILSFMKDSCTTVPSVDHLINKTSLLRTRDSRYGWALSIDKRDHK